MVQSADSTGRVYEMDSNWIEGAVSQDEPTKPLIQTQRPFTQEPPFVHAQLAAKDDTNTKGTEEQRKTTKTISKAKDGNAAPAQG